MYVCTWVRKLISHTVQSIQYVCWYSTVRNSHSIAYGLYCKQYHVIAVHFVGQIPAVPIGVSTPAKQSAPSKKDTPASDLDLFTAEVEINDSPSRLVGLPIVTCPSTVRTCSV